MTSSNFCGFMATGLAAAGLAMLATGCQKSKDSTSDQAASAEAYVIDVPLGLPPVPVPDDNPMTAAKVELGKLLYFDPRLSKSGTITCATCHDPKMAWAEHLPTSKGHEGGLSGGPVLGRPGRHPGGAGRGADREPGGDGLYHGRRDRHHCQNPRLPETIPRGFQRISQRSQHCQSHRRLRTNHPQRQRPL